LYQLPHRGHQQVHAATLFQALQISRKYGSVRTPLHLDNFEPALQRRERLAQIVQPIRNLRQQAGPPFGKRRH
jgi:hypothetical protein